MMEEKRRAGCEATLHVSVRWKHVTSRLIARIGLEQIGKVNQNINNTCCKRG